MIDVKVTQFFDRATVIEKVRDGTKSTLAKAGAFVRTRARSLLRRRKRSAQPGQPPSDHGGYLKRWIFFAYEAATQSVVIGPRLFRSSRPTVPQLLEGGGEIARHRSSGKPATYSKFPFMEPALEAERPKFPELFSDVVK